MTSFVLQIYKWLGGISSVTYFVTDHHNQYDDDDDEHREYNRYQLCFYQYHQKLENY